MRYPVKNQIALFLICCLFGLAGQTSLAQTGSKNQSMEPRPLSQSVSPFASESDDTINILTLGAILVGSGSATAVLGAALGAAGAQTVCPYFNCAGSSQSLDPLFPVGGAIMGSALAGAFGVYVAGAVTALFFSSNGKGPE
jgi:hypothetical protein